MSLRNLSSSWPCSRLCVEMARCPATGFWEARIDSGRIVAKPETEPKRLRFRTMPSVDAQVSAANGCSRLPKTCSDTFGTRSLRPTGGRSVDKPLSSRPLVKTCVVIRCEHPQFSNFSPCSRQSFTYCLSPFEPPFRHRSDIVQTRAIYRSLPTVGVGGFLCTGPTQVRGGHAAPLKSASTGMFHASSSHSGI